MYEISRDKLLSFIKQIYSLKDRLVIDINNSPVVKISSFEKKEGFYYVKGKARVTLSPIYLEETAFMVKVKFTKKELVMWTKQVSDWNNDSMEKGNVLKSVDTFKVHNINGRKYLSHSCGDELNDLFIINGNYSFSDGFSRELKQIDVEKLNDYSKEDMVTLPGKIKRRFKSLIRR